MIELLQEFPLIVSKLSMDSGGFNKGDLRLMVKGGNFSNNVDCEVLLLRLLSDENWSPRRFEQYTSGRATLREQGDGVILVSGSVSASLRIAEEEELLVTLIDRALLRREFQFSLKFSRDKILNSRVWLMTGSIESRIRRADGAGLLGRFLRTERIIFSGTARLFKEDFVSDAADEVGGQLFLRLVPVLIDDDSTAVREALASFDEMRRAANDLWAGQSIIAVEGDASSQRLNISDEIRQQATSGIIGELNIEIVNQFAGRISGVPVVLVKGFGRGKTIGAIPMDSHVIIDADHRPNFMALAHEVGHVLGGEHDGDRTVDRDRWVEAPESRVASVMRPSDETITINPQVLGPQARLHAPRWALFREIGLPS